MIVFKKFSFDSAHYLPNVPVGHKCKNMHGHTYLLTVYVEGSIENNEGWVIDFAVLKGIVEPIVNQLDHQVLNELDGLKNPTCERIAEWIWNQLKPLLPALSKVELWETPTSGAIYKGY